MITGLVFIKIQKGMMGEISSRLSEIYGITEAFSITGDYDLMVKIQVNEYSRLAEIVTERIQEIEGIKETRTMMTFKTFRFKGIEDGPVAGEPFYERALESESKETERLDRGKSIIRPILSRLTEGFDLSRTEIFELIQAINSDMLTDVQIAGFLTALVAKGPSIKEVAYIAQAMRKVAVPFEIELDAFLTDTCGTGGG